MFIVHIESSLLLQSQFKFACSSSPITVSLQVKVELERALFVILAMLAQTVNFRSLL